MRKVLTIGLVALFACAPAFAADTATPAATKATDTKAADTKTTNRSRAR